MTAAAPPRSSLLFVAAIHPSVFHPLCLAEGGRDLFRVVLELLRTVRRHGILLNLDDGTQFDGAYIQQMIEEWWTRDSLARMSVEAERLLAEATQAGDGAVAAPSSSRTRRRQGGSQGGGAGVAAGELRRLRKRHERLQAMPVEYGLMYTQAIEILANEGRLLSLSSEATNGPVLDATREDFAARLAALNPATLRPDLIVFPPGQNPAGGTPLMELAQGDLLMRLGVGDTVALKSSSGYRTALGRVVITARQRLALVDPYLATLAGGESSRHHDFVKLLFDLLTERPAGLPPLEITIHTGELGNESNPGRRMRTLQQHARRDRDRERYIEDIHQRLANTIRHIYKDVLHEHPHMAERVGRFRIILWLERYDFRETSSGRVVEARLKGERLHDRYLLADHVGIEFPYGLDCIDDTASSVGNGERKRTANNTILKMLSHSAKQFVDARFAWDNRRRQELPYECFAGPYEIHLKGLRENQGEPASVPYRS